MPHPRYSWSWTIPNDTSPTRADLLLTQAFQALSGQWEPDLPPTPWTPSRSQVQHWLAEGRFFCNGTALYSNKALLKPGDQLRLDGSEIVGNTQLHAPRSAPEGALSVPILFEDEHLVVVNKPPALTVHPAPTVKGWTLVDALREQKIPLSSIGSPMRPGIVHRIDQNTSGALVIAKSDAAYLKLIELFKLHQMERRYWALCYGALKQSPLKIETLIGRNPSDHKKMAVVQKNGKPALTVARSLQLFTASSKHTLSWIKAELHTGRTHQVRVHLTHVGCSLLGDPVYGTPSKTQTKWTELNPSTQTRISELPGQALHARVLAFKHPITGQHLKFEAEPFQDFADLLKHLKCSL